MFSLEVISFIICSLIMWFILVRTVFAYMPEFSFLKKANSWEDVLTQWIFLAPVTVIIAALLFTGSKIAYGSDWFAYFYYHQVVLDSLKDGQLLHWSSSTAGGFPWAGHPDQPSTTPLMIPILLFGGVFGIKINIAFIYIFYVLGTFLLARKYLRLSVLSSAAISSMAVSSTLVAVRVCSQKYTNVFDFLTPPCIFFFLEALYARQSGKEPFRNQRVWALTSTSILVGIMFYQGKLGAVVALLLLFGIGIHALIKARKGGYQRILWTGTITLLFTVLFAAPKILPMIEMLRIDSRFVPSWEELRQHIYRPERLFSALVTYKYVEIWWVTANRVIGLGIVPLMLAIYGFVSYPKRVLVWFMACVLFSLVALGDNSILPLGYYLWHLPIFHSMADLDKYFNRLIQLTPMTPRCSI